MNRELINSNQPFEYDFVRLDILLKYILNTHVKFAFDFVDFMKCYKVQASCILFTNYFIMHSYMFTSSSSVIIYKEPLMHREVT